MKFNIKYEYEDKIFNFRCVELLYFKGYIYIVGLNRDDNKLCIISVSCITTIYIYVFERKSPWKRISTKKNIRYFLSKPKRYQSVISIERDEIDKQCIKPLATELKKVIDILDKDYCNEI